MTDVCIEINTVLQPAETGRDPKTLLVSIGMATSDGHGFIAVNDDIPFDLCVTQLPPVTWKALPLLEDPMRIDRRDPDVHPLDELKAAFEAFIGQIDHPQFWSADGNTDHRTLVNVFGYISDSMLPDGFPHWISSVREHRSRILDRIGHQDQERLHHLQVSGHGESWPMSPSPRDAFKDAYRLLSLLEATEDLAHENDVDTTTREPAWLDWRHVWAPDAAVYTAPRQDNAAVTRAIEDSVRRTRISRNGDPA